MEEKKCKKNIKFLCSTYKEFILFNTETSQNRPPLSSLISQSLLSHVFFISWRLADAAGGINNVLTTSTVSALVDSQASADEVFKHSIWRNAWFVNETENDARSVWLFKHWRQRKQLENNFFYTRVVTLKILFLFNSFIHHFLQKINSMYNKKYKS